MSNPVGCSRRPEDAYSDACSQLLVESKFLIYLCYLYVLCWLHWVLCCVCLFAIVSVCPYTTFICVTAWILLPLITLQKRFLSGISDLSFNSNAKLLTQTTQTYIILQSNTLKYCFNNWHFLDEHSSCSVFIRRLLVKRSISHLIQILTHMGNHKLV